MKFGDEDFGVEIDLKNNTLTCHIIPNISNIEDLEYAYYLIKDGIKIETIWYTKSNYISFSLISSGIYSVNCFVKNEEDISIYCSSYIQYFAEVINKNAGSGLKGEKKYTVAIWGSCVSRDIFPFDEEKIYKVGIYIARNSIVSALSQPMEIKSEDIKLESNFQKIQVYNDLVKTSFVNLKNNISDYLIVDFIDERFELALTKQGIYTLSTEMISANILGDYKTINRKRKIDRNGDIFYCVDSKELTDYIDDFCDEISSIYGMDKIIIHKAFFSKFYKDKDGKIRRFGKNYQKYISETNDLLTFMYNRTIFNFPQAKVIDLKDKYIALEMHKWGLSPMHYQDDYYKEVLKLLSKIVQ